VRAFLASWDIEMSVHATRLEAAENELKQLMADVNRAMEKAEKAVVRMASKAGVATTEMACTASSP